MDSLSNAIHSNEWKWIFFPSVPLFRANFVLVETIIQIKAKPYNLSPTIGNHFLRVIYIYIYIPAGESSFSAQ